MTVPDRRTEAPSPWPVATLDPVALLRALAAGLDGVAIEERRLDARFEDVWSFISDLERSIPTFDRTVASIRILETRGEKLRVRAGSTRHHGFVPLTFDVDLRPGWCWMVSRPQLYVVGMAAVPDGSGTRFAHMEGLAIPWAPLRPLLQRVARRQARHVRSDLNGIERATLELRS